MLISKNVNNDVSKDLPITEATEMIQMINPGLKQSLLSSVRKTFPRNIFNYDLTRETPM